MNIEQFKFDYPGLGFVFGYLIWSGFEAAVIDGCAAEEILGFCDKNGLKLKVMTNTHMHSDHIAGNEKLSAHAAVLIDPSSKDIPESFTLGDDRVEVLRTPGHSADSVVFYTDGKLITGDTLFTGTVGNCYTKDYPLYFKSLSAVMAYPDETEIYCGHDIFEYATGVIREIDPDNTDFEAYLRIRNRKQLFSTIGLEKKVNPFVSWHDGRLDSYRGKLKMQLDTPYDKWRAMMTVH